MPMQIIGSGTRMDDVTIAKVTTGGHIWVAGSISSMPTISVTPTGSQEVFTSTGSVEMYGTIATTPGSESVITAGSVQTYDPIGIGSVHLVPGSLEVYQTTASDLTVSGVLTIDTLPIVGISGTVVGVSGIVNQGTTPWITSGTSTVAGSVFTTGSLRVANLYEGSEVWQGTDPWVISGNIVIGSVSAWVDNVYIQSGNNVLGSMHILTDPVPISGVVDQGTSPWVVSGTATISGLISVSGVFHDVLGSVSVQQDTIPWITSGTATVSGLFHDVIGSVYVSQIVPGTAATNLGKAEDIAHTTGDVGVMALAVRMDDADAFGADGDYTPLTTSDHGCLNTDPQHYFELDGCNVTTGWSVLGDDTINLGTDTNHIEGTASLKFDKTDGSDNTTIAGIQKTITSISAEKYLHEGGGFILASYYLSSIAEVDYVFIRLGTDSSHYNEWRVSADDMTVGWNNVRYAMTKAEFAGSTGNGWDSDAITYLAIGAGFDAQNDALADIRVDSLHLNSGMQTSSDITAQVSSSVSSPNVIVRAWGNAVDTNTGNAGANTLRTVLATDQARLAGSIVNMPIVGISGTVIGVSGIVNQGTDPWSVSGTATIEADSDAVFGVSGTVVGVSGIMNLGGGVGSVVISGTSVPVSRGVGSVLGLFTDSSNTLNSPLVANGSYLMVAGSISSMPAISVSEGAAYLPSGLITDLGSVYFVGGERAGSIWPLQIVGGSHLLIAGSISSMPSVTAENSSDYKVSGTWLGVGSASLMAANYNGSVYPLRVEGGSQLLVTGSVYQTDTTRQITAGSIRLISTTGSIGTYYDGEVGSVVISGTSIPVSRGVGSVLGLFTDSSNTLDSPLVANGSYLMVAGSISSMPSVSAESASDYKVSGTWDGGGVGSASLVAGNYNGSVYPIRLDAGSQLLIAGSVSQTTDPWIVSGTSTVSGVITIDTLPDVVGVSGTLVGVSGIVNQGTVPWEVSGTATISADADSIFGISGTVVGISGIVNQGTSPWTISGVVNVGSIVGSVAITNFAALGSQRTISAGSVIITNELTISEVGSPCYKRATLVASGTYTNVWAIGGGGSSFEMHGYHISTNKPGYVRICTSGTALATTQAGVIADYHLNYDSGAAIEKTFSTPIIPNGAGSPVGFGTTVAGSTLVTFYGREVK